MGEFLASLTVISLDYGNLEEKKDERSRVPTWKNKKLQIQEKLKSALLLLIPLHNI